jgi:hypothetical protein
VMCPEPASLEVIERSRAMFGANKPDEQAQKSNSFDVEAYCKHYGLEIVKIKQNGTSTLYCFKECPFDPSHGPNEAAIGVTTEGKLFFQCFHNGCQGHTWHELKEKVSGKDPLKPFIRNGIGKDEGRANKEPGEIEETVSLWDKLPRGRDLQAMDINIEWIVEGLIPKQSVTTLTGAGGTGKSYLLMSLMEAVAKGEPFLGLSTCKMDALFVSFEQSLPVDIDRCRKLNITDTIIWHNATDPRHPPIDSPEYTIYLSIKPCLMVFDSLRSSQSGDENSSKDMTLAMSRYQELRDYGHTVVIIIHTLKANERMFRGSMAISDKADHPLYFYPVRNTKSNEAVEDANFDELPFYLGTTEKTRFNHFKIYIKRANGRFVVADDPKIEKIVAIAELCQGRTGIKKEEVIDLVNKELGFGKGTVRKLLDDKEGKKYWTITSGLHNSQLFSFYPYIRGGRTEEQKTGSYSDTQDNTKQNKTQDIDNTDLFSSSGGKCRTEEHSNINDIESELTKEEFETAVQYYIKQGVGRAEAEKLVKEGL